jgi:hypothetical protein
LFTDCVYYPASKKLIVVNSNNKRQTTNVFSPNGETTKVQVKAYGIRILTV